MTQLYKLRIEWKEKGGVWRLSDTAVTVGQLFNGYCVALRDGSDMQVLCQHDTFGDAQECAEKHFKAIAMAFLVPVGVEQKKGSA